MRLIDSGFLVGNGLMGGHKMLKFRGGRMFMGNIHLTPWNLISGIVFSLLVRTQIRV